MIHMDNSQASSFGIGKMRLTGFQRKVSKICELPLGWIS